MSMESKSACSMLIPPLLCCTAFPDWCTSKQITTFSSVGVLNVPKLPALLILSYHAFRAFTMHMPLLIGFCWALCPVSYQVRGFRRGLVVLLMLTSPKVTQKGAKLSDGKRKAPRRAQLQFKGKLANQTLCRCQRKLMLKMSDKCLILKTYLNQRVIGLKKTQNIALEWR